MSLFVCYSSTINIFERMPLFFFFELMFKDSSNRKITILISQYLAAYNGICGDIVSGEHIA